MVNSKIKSELIKKLDQMQIEQQEEVLRFAHSLICSKDHGTPGKNLLSFAGKIGKRELETMATAIEEECEKVHLDEW